MAQNLRARLFGNKGYISQVEHTHHRSLWNFLGNVAAGLIACTFREKKPSLKLRIEELLHLSAVVC